MTFRILIVVSPFLSPSFPYGDNSTDIRATNGNVVFSDKPPSGVLAMEKLFKDVQIFL